LTYDPGDPYVHYALGLAFGRRASRKEVSRRWLRRKKHFRAMLDINAEMDEAKIAKTNLAAIDTVLAAR
jgi:hypothetical protein